jgi:hypothetical protein
LGGNVLPQILDLGEEFPEEEAEVIDQFFLGCDFVDQLAERCEGVTWPEIDATYGEVRVHIV